MKPKKNVKKPVIWYAIRFADGSTVGQLYVTRKTARWDQNVFWEGGKVIKVKLVEVS